MKSLLLLFMFVAYVSTEETIISKINTIIEEEKLLGLSIAIIAKGEVIFTDGFGIRDWEL
jgi:hypothetical protein